jgi:hypothetical protein
MLRRTPKLTDDMILANASRSRESGPAVIDTTPVLARHAAQQAADRTAMEDAGRGLALQKKRLSQNADQFGKTMQMQRDTLNTNKKLSDISNIISGAGLGLSAVNSYQNRQRSLQRQNKINEMIKNTKRYGYETDMFISDFISALQ